jgi:hypothetical protein
MVGQTDEDMSCEFDDFNSDMCGLPTEPMGLSLTQSSPCNNLYLCFDRGTNWVRVGWT